MHIKQPLSQLVWLAHTQCMIHCHKHVCAAKTIAGCKHDARLLPHRGSKLHNSSEYRASRRKDNEDSFRRHISVPCLPCLLGQAKLASYEDGGQDEKCAKTRRNSWPWGL